MEPELQNKLDGINKNLTEINKNTRGSHWKALWNGVLSGLGSVIGVAIALAIIGWILNKVGVIPAFRSQVHQLQSTLDQLEKNK